MLWKIFSRFQLSSLKIGFLRQTIKLTEFLSEIIQTKIYLWKYWMHEVFHVNTFCSRGSFSACSDQDCYVKFWNRYMSYPLLRISLLVACDGFATNWNQFLHLIIWYASIAIARSAKCPFRKNQNKAIASGWDLSYIISITGIYRLPYSSYHKHKKKWSLRANWLIAAELIPGFCSMKRLGVFLLPLDVPPQFVRFPICWYPFILLGGERHCEI